MRKPPLQRSFANAARGIVWIFRNERNFQIEFLALLANIFLIFYFQVSTAEAAIIILVCFTVLSLELLNTCIEKICDVVQPEFDIRIKIIKDVAAGSVFLMAIAAIIIGLLIYPKYVF